MMLYVSLCWVYLKIGVLGFGGGFAMLSLIQHEVVEVYKWISPEEFTDIVAISQMTPGPIGINSATYIGYTATGSVWGAVVATLAVMFPSFVLITLVGRLLLRYHNNRFIISIFAMMRPVIVGLIASAALLLMTPSTFGDYTSVIIFVGAFLLTYAARLHPIWVILLAGGVGYLIY